VNNRELLNSKEKVDNDATLQQVIAAIREAIAEDWVQDFEIDADTSLNNDLEIESIEFVSIADKLQKIFGDQVDVIGWLSQQNIETLIAMTVGDLVKIVEQGR
jgi:acyl carrier protein